MSQLPGMPYYFHTIYPPQIAAAITETFTAIKAESPEMSRTIISVINAAGGGDGADGAGGTDAVVTYPQHKFYPYH